MSESTSYFVDQSGIYGASDGQTPEKISTGISAEEASDFIRTHLMSKHERIRLERLESRLDHEAKRITFKWAFNHFLFSRDSDRKIAREVVLCGRDSANNGTMVPLR